MLDVLAHRPSLSTSYSVADLLGVYVTAAVIGIWAGVAGGAFSLLAVLACEAAFFAFYLVGSLVAGWRPLAAGVLFDLPLRLLVGYAVVNTALFALAWLSPLGILANFGILLAIAAGLFFASRPRRERRAAPWARPGTTAAAGPEDAGDATAAGRGRGAGPAWLPLSDEWVGLLVLGVSLVAAALWCQDSLRPTAVQDQSVAFKPWVDGFYHAIHIRIFGAAHGAASIEDFRMAGLPARLYHYGCYLTPALIWRASGIHSYAAFAGILAPMGVCFTGLGAYALVGSLWGRWPGLAACAALLVLPDGVQQGMQDTFLSYHWLTQISPSANYGLALLAMAWLFVLLGCTRGSRLQLLAGWLVAGVLVVYKLHFFIASALLLWLLPPLCFRARLGIRRRALWALSALAAYGVTLHYVQKVPGVPLIRFDGSCIGQVLTLVLGFTPPGALRSFLAEHIGTGQSWLSNLGYGAPFVLLAALGGFAPLLVILAIRLRKRVPLLLLLFPLLLVANFLAMFFGLALDYSSSTPDELSHRPVILMYFGVVTWVGGAAGLLLVSARRWRRLARPLLLGATLVLLAVPAVLGSGVQRMWAMPRFSPLELPLGVYRAAQYLREHADAHDVFQDSRIDRTYAVAALSERRVFVARTLTRMDYNAERLEQRVEAIEALRSLRDPAGISATARALGIRWFLLCEGDWVDWPAAILDRPVFAQAGFRLYQF